MSDEKTFQAGDDPADYTVAQVNAYLETLDAEDPERSRIVEAEQAGKARTGILDGPTQEVRVDPATGAPTLQEQQEAPPVKVEGEAYQKGYAGHSPARDAGEDLTLPAVLRRQNGED